MCDHKQPSSAAHLEGRVVNFMGGASRSVCRLCVIQRPRHITTLGNTLVLEMVFSTEVIPLELWLVPSQQL